MNDAIACPNIAWQDDMRAEIFVIAYGLDADITVVIDDGNALTGEIVNS